MPPLLLPPLPRDQRPRPGARRATEAASAPDEMDQYPLHEAVDVKLDDALIKAIYDAYPEAATIENRDCNLIEGFWTTNS